MTDSGVCLAQCAKNGVHHFMLSVLSITLSLYVSGIQQIWVLRMLKNQQMCVRVCECLHESKKGDSSENP